MKKIAFLLLVGLTAPTFGAYSFRTAMAHLERNKKTHAHSIAFATLVKKATMARRESKRVRKFFDFLEASMREFDFRQLYESDFLRPLPNKFRGAGLVGRNLRNHYQLSFSKSTYAHTPLPGFGDLSSEAGLRRIEKSIAGDTSFQLYAKAKTNVVHVSHTNALAFVQGLQQVLDPGNLARMNRPTCALYKKLTEDARKLMDDFCHHFPQMANFMHRYGYLDSLIKVRSHQGKKYTEVNMVGHPRMKAVRRDYPAIHKYLDDLDDVGYFSAAFKNRHGHTVSSFTMDSKTLTMQWKAFTRKGRVVPVDKKGKPVFKEEFDLRKFKKVAGYAVVNARLRIYGLQIEAHNIIASGDVMRTNKGATLATHFTKVPKLKFSGRFWHVIPTWMMDFGMPGNLDELGQKFMRVLAKGNDGKGTRLRIDWQKAGRSRNHLRLQANTELLDNRFIKFAMRIWMNRIRMDNKASTELDRLTGRVFTAMLGDLRELHRK